MSPLMVYISPALLVYTLFMVPLFFASQDGSMQQVNEGAVTVIHNMKISKQQLPVVCFVPARIQIKEKNDAHRTFKRDWLN